MARIASATVRPCETRTSTCRSLATASSGRCFLLAISVLLRFEPIPQRGPLRRGRITRAQRDELAQGAAERTGRPGRPARPERRRAGGRQLRLEGEEVAALLVEERVG